MEARTSRTWRRRACATFVGALTTAALGLSPTGVAVAGDVWTGVTNDIAAPGCSGTALSISGYLPGDDPRPSSYLAQFTAERGCRAGTTISVSFIGGAPGAEPVVVDQRVTTVARGDQRGRRTVGVMPSWEPQPGGFAQVNVQTCSRGTCGPVHWLRLAADSNTVTRGSVPAGA